MRAEKSIKGEKHNLPWSPRLNDAIKTLSLWKIILTQQKTKISHRNQIERIQRSMHSKLDITWKKYQTSTIK